MKFPPLIWRNPDVMEEARHRRRGMVYERDVNWIQNCDVLIAEVSVPSHGVGYEIGFALNMGKPVLCLLSGRAQSLKNDHGNPHPHLTVQLLRNRRGMAISPDQTYFLNQVDFVNIITSISVTFDDGRKNWNCRLL